MNRRLFVRYALSAIVAAASFSAFGKPGATPLPTGPPAPASRPAVGVLTDDYGFLHMGGWIRGPHPGMSVGQRIVLFDGDYPQEYVVVGRFIPL